MNETSPFKAHSLVVNPPEVVGEQLRFRLEASAFAMQTAYRSITNIEAIVETYCKNDQPVAVDERVIPLATHCWSVVDQTHMLTDFLTLYPDHPSIGAFVTRYDAAREIRTVTRHLRSRLKQLVAKKDAAPTIFGVLTFLNYLGTIQDSAGHECHDGEYWSIPFGPLNSQSKIKMPENISPPNQGVCFLEFTAHGFVIKLHELKGDICKLAALLEDGLRSSLLSSPEAKKIDNLVLESLPRPMKGIISMRAHWRKSNPP
jgi:hypothetical protein